MNDQLFNLVKNGFGFDPSESQHHFVVDIPRSGNAEIKISEHLTWDDEKGSSKVTLGNAHDGQLKVLLSRNKWDAIAEELRSQFNSRLKRMGKKAGSWHAGVNLIRRELGKELLVLAWAIEDADPARIPIAITNWNGLVPEERWWLYTQTAAATGHASRDRGKGWRKALRFALTENPVQGGMDAMTPDFFLRAEKGPAWNSLDTIEEDEDKP